MNWIGPAIVVVMMAFVGAMAFVRLAPTEAAQWHVDPTDPALASGPGQALVRDDGSLQSPVYEASPEEVLAAFDTIADATPRTRVVAGSVAEGQISSLCR